MGLHPNDRLQAFSQTLDLVVKENALAQLRIILVGEFDPYNKFFEVNFLTGALLYGRLLASPENTRLGWKGLPGTNTLAYYENP